MLFCPIFRTLMVIASFKKVFNNCSLSEIISQIHFDEIREKLVRNLFRIFKTYIAWDYKIKTFLNLSKNFERINNTNVFMDIKTNPRFWFYFLIWLSQMHFCALYSKKVHHVLGWRLLTDL